VLKNKQGKPVLWLVTDEGRIRQHPNHYQKEVLDDVGPMFGGTQYLFFIGGSGTGKSSLIPLKLFSWITKRHGGRYLVVEPIYSMVDQIALTYVKEYFDHTPLKGTWSEKHRCYKGTSFEIFFGSADKPDHLEGGQFDGIICDEVAEYRKRVWTVLQGRVLLKEGQFFGCSTPYPGKTQAWLADEPYEEWKGGSAYYKFIQCPSPANPAFPKEEFERFRRELPPAEFAMRYMGEFSAAVGLVYDLKKEAIEPHGEPPEHADVWCGVDFGFGHPTTFVWCYESEGIIHCFREYYASAIDYETHVLNTMKWMMDYNVRRVYYDPSMPQGAMELKKWFKKNGLEISFLAAINDLRMGITEITKLLATDRLHISEHCTELKDEFRNYVWKGDKPVDEGDDLLDALRYAVMGQRQYKAQRAKSLVSQEPVFTKGALRISKIFEQREISEWFRRV
jgi:energy-coupling factor transporter ATP-binding protein EcfA2